MDGEPQTRVNVFGLPKADLEAFVGSLGSKPFRARQLMNWLYKRGESDIAAMTDLAKDFRADLVTRAAVKLPEIVKTQTASDGTRKWLLRTPDGHDYEMGFIPDADRGIASPGDRRTGRCAVTPTGAGLSRTGPGGPS